MGLCETSYFSIFTLGSASDLKFCKMIMSHSTEVVDPGRCGWWWWGNKLGRGLPTNVCIIELLGLGKYLIIHFPPHPSLQNV